MHGRQNLASRSVSGRHRPSASAGIRPILIQGSDIKAAYSICSGSTCQRNYPALYFGTDNDPEASEPTASGVSQDEKFIT